MSTAIVTKTKTKMAAPAPADASQDKPRQRKSHRKSRLGCGNCKLRSVKCDEAKPSCSRCRDSGFTCNYSRSAPALQLAHAGAFKLDLTGNSPIRMSNGATLRLGPGAGDLPPAEPGIRLPVALPMAGRLGEYEMRPADFEALGRFNQRTSWTVGNQSTRTLYREGAFALAATHPFLIHVFLAVSLIHDIHLNPAASTPAHRSSLAFHWYHGTVLFKRQLLKANLSGTERDALWASAALLGAASFAYTDYTDVADAWPLRPASQLDLDWLKMSDGKKVVWAICDPSRPESMFHPLVQQTKKNPIPSGLEPLHRDSALPDAFWDLLGLEGSSPPENPYYSAASIIAQLLPVEISDENVLSLLTFISQIDPRFRTLLEQKDPRALLLLSYWYSKTAHLSLWWLHRRSMVEGPAICTYLEQQCADDARVQQLLVYPRSQFDKIQKELEAKGQVKPFIKMPMPLPEFPSPPSSVEMAIR